MAEKFNYSVLVPAYNAEKTLETVLVEISKLENKPSEIVVINDGSRDLTGTIAQKQGAFLISWGSNKGKGFALKTGFDLFINELNSDYLLCIDADLQHPPKYIKDFLLKSKNNEKALLIGKRDISLKNMPIMRYLSNKITSYIISWLSGYKISDSQCGFRLIPKSALLQLKFKENGFQLESEFILRCADKNIPIEFVEIPTVYNKNGSNINHISDTYKFIILVIKEMFKR